MAKILLLDSAFAAVPIHNWLSEIGLEVWTVGNRPFDPLALSFPDRWISCDYSDSKLVQKIVLEHGFDLVIPGCTDVSMRTFVNLDCTKYYKCSKEVDLLLNNKSEFRKLCLEIGIPSPKLFDISTLPSSGKIICKPVDGFSGRGVNIFEASDSSAMEQCITVAKENSAAGEILLEEFVEGELHSFSTFIEGGKVIASFVVKEGSHYDPFSVDVSYVVNDVAAAELQVLSNSVELIARRLQLCDGLLHVQYLRSENRIAIVEVTRRCPGDLYSLLIEKSTGFKFAAKYASYFTPFRTECSSIFRRFVLRRTLKENNRAKFFSIELDASSKCEIVPVRIIGEELSSERFERTSVVFYYLSNFEKLIGEYNRILSTKQY